MLAGAAPDLTWQRLGKKQAAYKVIPGAEVACQCVRLQEAGEEAQH
jgi:hypothetical protein